MGGESRKLGAGSGELEAGSGELGVGSWELGVVSFQFSVTVVSGEFGDESREFRLLFFYELELTSTQSSLYQLI
jgi:hypothetical protein